MTKGQTTISLVVALGAMASVILGWNSWLSVRSVSTGEELSAVGEWQKGADKRFDKLDSSLDDLNRKLDLIAPKLGVNTSEPIYFIHSVASTTSL